ncbi:MAG: aldehyde-activating protein [Rheinheimera sp.]|uniref:GFA family protein n=1 Tax=Arsukibacterium sp. UBA3155 TaxID=1946058 RepID=UPI000C8E4358|nr:GFA family protein [Arsukibacterium sp. UBA3155]MAD75856.1 aldehyde-activating protein [Rheinheimera sp.]|tara:strand:- start:10872 stop:11279 length:408 start_codon:yes stop_codon:yes gene_type:complete
MYQGGCLCGEVAIEVSGPINSIIHCHCSLCRKSSGTAFATNGFVQTTDFIVVKGAERLSQFAFKPGRIRYFCNKCGSPVYSCNVEDPSRVRIRLGILTTAISERPQSHNFYSSKANWEDLDENLPRYDSFEPGRK